MRPWRAATKVCETARCFMVGTHSTLPIRRARGTLPSIPSPASRGILSSFVRGEATDCRPEAQRWMICTRSLYRGELLQRFLIDRQVLGKLGWHQGDEAPDLDWRMCCLCC